MVRGRFLLRTSFPGSRKWHVWLRPSVILQTEAGEEFSQVHGDHPLMKQEASSYIEGLTARPGWQNPAAKYPWAAKLQEGWKDVAKELEEVASPSPVRGPRRGASCSLPFVMPCFLTQIGGAETRAVLKQPDFFFEGQPLRTAPTAANGRQPPQTGNRQPPTAINCHQPPTANL